MAVVGMDQEAVIKMFAQASVQQGEALRGAVRDAMLKALQGRELTLANIRNALETVTQAASTGAAKSSLPIGDVRALLGRAFAGMDAALLQAVHAHQAALRQFVAQGVGLQEQPMKEAIANIEKINDVFFTSVGKAAQESGGALKGAWEQVLTSMRDAGTQTGAGSVLGLKELMAQAQAVLSGGHRASVRGAQAMMENYTTLVSGVLIGMSEALTASGRSDKDKN